MLIEAAARAADYLLTPPGLGDQMTAAAVCAYAIQAAKKSNLPVFGWINEHSKDINRAVSLALAAASTLGIHAVFERSADHGGSLIISGIPSLDEALPMAWKILGSFIMQDGWYHFHLLVKGIVGQSPAEEPSAKNPGTVLGLRDEVHQAMEQAHRDVEAGKKDTNDWW